MRRREFLNEFLGALGAVELAWDQEIETSISGRVIYEQDDPEEVQDFIWHKREVDVPKSSVLNLARLLKRDNLLSIDKITVSRYELRQRYNQSFQLDTSEAEFENILEELLKIEVRMVDDGKETDIFFIHE